MRKSEYSLLHELILAIKLVRQVFGFKTRVLCFVGNVASMGKIAGSESEFSHQTLCPFPDLGLVLLDQLRCSRVGRSSNHRYRSLNST